MQTKGAFLGLAFFFIPFSLWLGFHLPDFEFVLVPKRGMETTEIRIKIILRAKKTVVFF